MRKTFNFSAGPAMVPEEVLLQAQEEMLNWRGTDHSIMELGHRGPEFKIIADEAEENLRSLMAIPKNYHILFLAGGASHQFTMVPMNLLNSQKKADYIDTGIWSKKAIIEAEYYGKINVVTKVKEENDLLYIPHQDQWNLDPQASYVHYTPNETIDGIEFHFVPQTGDVPLIADMTSMILSRKIDVTKYGLIYAGAQKNIGQAGITIVIIRDDLLKNPLPGTPTLYNYNIHCEHKSFYNTPPTYSWYISGLVLAWMKKKGGVEYFEKLNQRKANKLYKTINNFSHFYINRIHPDCRSLMNVVFSLSKPELTETFLKEASEVGLKHLKGHRVVGGVRASIYNAMPEEGIDILTAFMRDFAERNS